MITVQGISKSFGDVVAVNNISFSINTGEITGLLGPNGAGKTTTLRMLTCYLKPDMGAIQVGEFNVIENQQEVKKLIGYLPESAPIYGDMMVYEYLDYVAELQGVEDKGRIKEMGELCGITDVMHKNIMELSKGYKQRVGLAHAMLHDPDILVLDEPTSGLDPNQIIEIRNLIKELGKRKTVILSTHILPEVEATCDRVIIINKGNIVADDRTENLHGYSKKDKSIYIEIKGAAFQEMASALKDISGVNSVNEMPNQSDLTSATVFVSGDDEVRPDIFNIINAKGWTLYEMHQEQKSLEHVFSELTAGGSNE